MLIHRHVAIIALVGILGATTAATAGPTNFIFGFGKTHKAASVGGLTQIIDQQGNGHQFGADVGINSTGTQSLTQTQSGSGGSAGTQIGVNVSIGSTGGSQSIHATQSVH